MNPVPTRPSRTTRLVSAWQRWRGTLKPMLDTLPCIAVPAAGIEALSGPQAFRQNARFAHVDVTYATLFGLGYATTPEEYAKLIREDYERYGKVVKQAGVRVE